MTLILGVQANAHVRDFHLIEARAKARNVVSIEPADWRRSARLAAENAEARKPVSDGEPRFPLTYRKTAPGADLADARTRWNNRLGVFTHDPPPPVRGEKTPRHAYVMRSDIIGPYHTVFDRKTGIPLATLRGGRSWVEHEVMRYARSLHATSKDFRVLPCIAFDHGGDGLAAADRHDPVAYVSP